MPVRLLPALLLAALSALPAQSGERPACTCHEIESLQQDLQQNLYMADYMQRLSDYLKPIEANQRDLNDNRPSDPNAGRLPDTVSAQAREAYNQTNLNPPFWTIKGYYGPRTVDMPYGTCKQDETVLKALERGSPCDGMAQAALNHERRHREICEQMGARAYWDRLPSALAAEEAQVYRQQAADLRAELRRVLDASDIRFLAQFDPVLSAAGGQIRGNYHQQVETGDIGQSQGGPERWVMTGAGSAATSMSGAVVMGQTCTPSGVMSEDVQVAMTTDGLTFGLGYAGGNRRGGVSLVCPNGMSMAMPPQSSVSGNIMEGIPIKEGETEYEADWGRIARSFAAQAGASIEGSAHLVVSITCTP